MHEAEGDDDGTGQTKLPAEPKKRGFLDKVFGPSEETLAWNAEWSKLTPTEKEIYVAFVKRDPNLPTILGTAVKNRQFTKWKFAEFLALPGAFGSEELRRLVGSRHRGPERGPGSNERSLPDGRDFRSAIDRVAFDFSAGNPQGLFARAERLRKASDPMIMGRFVSTPFTSVVNFNSELVAALESFYDEYIEIDSKGRVVEPPEGSRLRKFTDAAYRG